LKKKRNNLVDKRRIFMILFSNFSLKYFILFYFSSKSFLFLPKDKELKLFCIVMSIYF